MVKRIDVWFVHIVMMSAPNLKSWLIVVYEKKLEELNLYTTLSFEEDQIQQINCVSGCLFCTSRVTTKPYRAHRKLTSVHFGYNFPLPQYAQVLFWLATQVTFWLWFSKRMFIGGFCSTYQKKNQNSILPATYMEIAAKTMPES